jgi:hypothetical protein
MSESFSVGDVVECVKHPDAYISAWRRVGQQATIASLYANETIDGRPLHRLRSHVDGRHFLCSERCMRKIPPPPIREQTWDLAYIQWRDALVKEFAMGEPSHV